jgi:hypothetical protein
MEKKIRPIRTKSFDDPDFPSGTTRMILNKSYNGSEELVFTKFSMKLYEHGVYVGRLYFRYYKKPFKFIYLSKVDVEKPLRGQSSEDTSGIGGSILRRLQKISDRTKVPIFLEKGMGSANKPEVLNIYENHNFVKVPGKARLFVYPESTLEQNWDDFIKKYL